MANENIIEAVDLKKIFKMGNVQVEALRGATFSVKAKEFVILFGPSGVGKSTIISLIAGLEKPTSGDVIIRGENIVNYNDRQLEEFRRKKIGLVFQDFNLIPNLTAVENVAMPLVFDKVTERVREKKAKKILDELGIGHRLNHRPMQMSGGERQRVGIARALINNPWVLLVDEPTGDLDRKNADEIMKLLSNLNKKSLRTVLLVTHDLRYLDMADRILEVEDGKVTKEKRV